MTITTLCSIAPISKEILSCHIHVYIENSWFCIKIFNFIQKGSRQHPVVEDAWSGIKEEKEMIIQSFVKCGLSNKLDSSEDHIVNIRGIEGYVMLKQESEFHLESVSDSSESEYDEGTCDDASSSSSD